MGLGRHLFCIGLVSALPSSGASDFPVFSNHKDAMVPDLPCTVLDLHLQSCPELEAAIRLIEFPL